MEVSTSTGENGYRRRGSDDVSASDLLRILRRQQWWIVGVGTFVVAAVAILTFLQAPVYRAQTTLRVEEHQSTAVPVLDALSDLAGGAKVETEMEIVRSRQVAEDVVEDLALQASIESPRRSPREQLFSVFEVDRGAEESRYQLRLNTRDYELEGPESTERSAYGRPVTVGPLTVMPRSPDPAVSANVVRLELVTFPVAVGRLLEELSVTRPQREAGIIAVSYESTDAPLARDVVNTAARHFLAFRNEMEKQRASATVRFLREQVVTLEVQLAEAEAALKQFRQENLLVHAETQVEEDVRRLADLQATRSELEVERTALRQLLFSVAEQSAPRQSWAQVASFPTFMQNEAITNILEQLTLLETELSRLEARRTPDDPDVQNLLATIQLLETRLAALAHSYLTALDRQAVSMDASLAQFDSELQKVPAVEVQYARLQRTTDVLGELYTFLQTRLKEAEVAEAVEIANIQVVDPAVAPIEPVRPRKLLNLFLGFLLGGVLAIGTAFVRESLDTRLRSRDELTELTGLPVLATVPRIPVTNGRRSDAAARIEARLVTHHSPRSPAAEAYRTLRTNLTFSAAGLGRSLKKIVFTSAEPQEGKSTTAANAAITLAEQGHATLLVECDLRRPMLHRVFHERRDPGLVEVLVGSTTFEHVVREVPMPDYVEGSLGVVTAGASPPNPAELLGSGAMKAFLDEAARRYEMVILDTPPLNVVTDATVVGTLADGVVLVTRQGSTHREALRLACQELRGVNANLVGTVLNDLSASEDGYGYRYAYRQYYGSDAD